MKEYRTTLELDPETSYTYVELGPVEGMPAWHCLAQPSRWPFPTPESAQRFASAARGRHPGREVTVR
ncbi:hypothetical protein SEA_HARRYHOUDINI_73 [Mycobacterium phage HarryHoudini]|nr:hypothetical protein SEA_HARRYHOUDINI_73 [Mycobacterium phage HarryHoudini]